MEELGENMEGESSSSEKGSSDPSLKDLMTMIQQLMINSEQAQKKTDRQFGEVKEISNKQGQALENTSRLVQEMRENSEKQFQQMQENSEQIKENSNRQFEEIKEGQKQLKKDLQKGIAQVILQFSQTNGFLKPVLLEEGNEEDSKEDKVFEEEVESQRLEEVQEINREVNKENLVQLRVESLRVELEIDGGTKTREQVESTSGVEDGYQDS